MYAIIAVVTGPERVNVGLSAEICVTACVSSSNVHVVVFFFFFYLTIFRESVSSCRQPGKSQTSYARLVKVRVVRIVVKVRIVVLLLVQ